MSWDNSREAVLRRRAERARRLERAASHVVEALSRKPDVLKIVLFGSMARGETDARSDLDLVVIQETRKGFFDRLDEVYGAVRPTVDMDLLVYTPEEWERLCAERAFFATIAREGKVLYERIGPSGSPAVD